MAKFDVLGKVPDGPNAFRPVREKIGKKLLRTLIDEAIEARSVGICFEDGSDPSGDGRREWTIVITAWEEREEPAQ